MMGERDNEDPRIDINLYMNNLSNKIIKLMAEAEKENIDYRVTFDYSFIKVLFKDRDIKNKEEIYINRDAETKEDTFYIVSDEGYGKLKSIELLITNKRKEREEKERVSTLIDNGLAKIKAVLTKEELSLLVKQNLLPHLLD